MLLKMCDLYVKYFIKRWNTVVFIIPYVSVHILEHLLPEVLQECEQKSRGYVVSFFLLALPKSLFDERIKLAIFCRIVFSTAQM